MKYSFRIKKILWGLIIIGIFSLTVGCQKDNKLKNAEAFIRMQLECETYKNIADAKEDALKQKFLVYLTEEGYAQYEKEAFLYMYPQIFHLTSAEKTNIKKIKCKQISKEGEERKCVFEVKYDIITTKRKKVHMKDEIELTINSKGQITRVIILNSSDLIHKLFLDVKIQ